MLQALEQFNSQRAMTVELQDAPFAGKDRADICSQISHLAMALRTSLKILKLYRMLAMITPINFLSIITIGILNKGRHDIYTRENTRRNRHLRLRRFGVILSEPHAAPRVRLPEVYPHSPAFVYGGKYITTLRSSPCTP